MTAITIATAEAAAIRTAAALPSLLVTATATDPAPVASVTGKALIASRTPWGTILLPVVVYVAGRYGFGWSTDIDTLVAGAAVLVGSYAMRAITSLPISGLFHKKPVVAVVPVAVAA